MPVSKEFTETLHKEFLHILINLLETNAVTVDYSRKVTRNFLDLFPSESMEELSSTFKVFTDNHPVFKQMYIQFLTVKEEHQTKDILTKMRSFMKENKLDKSIQVN